MSFTSFNKFNGNQVILSSDRLIFNAKNDNIFLLANKDISISANGSIHINVGKLTGDNSKSSIIVNSPRVQFGLSGSGKTVEPVTKAEAMVSVMNQLLSDISSFMNDLSSAKGLVSGGVASLPQINLAAKAMMTNIKSVMKKLDSIKSKTTFTT